MGEDFCGPISQLCPNRSRAAREEKGEIGDPHPRAVLTLLRLRDAGRRPRIGGIYVGAQERDGVPLAWLSAAPQTFRKPGGRTSTGATQQSRGQGTRPIQDPCPGVGGLDRHAFPPVSRSRSLRKSGTAPPSNWGSP